jgi:brefeldin A-resistance guanine nucleotide exchange factor 1
LSSVTDGVPSLVELLRVVINILDPNERIHTDSTRLLALGILNTIFEVSGSRLGVFPSLRTMVLDHGCKYLFQLARSENAAILQLALRTIATMLNSMRAHFKLQQELFLAFTLDRLAPPVMGKTPRLGSGTPMLGRMSPRGGTPRTFSPLLEAADEAEAEKGSPMPNKPSVLPARGETRELLLETLCQVSQHPGFMVELFVNYDCDINSENVFERLIDVLTKVICALSYHTCCGLMRSVERVHRILRGYCIWLRKLAIPLFGSLARFCKAHVRADKYRRCIFLWTVASVLMYGITGNTRTASSAAHCFLCRPRE